MIKLKIDGKDIQTAKGSTILKVAKQNGIEIPTLCYHEGLSPLTNCRLCVVEVTENNWTKVVTSCNYAVSDGMEVQTKTDNIIAMRKVIIELLLARSPNVKVVREMAAEMGLQVPRFVLENEKCILCGLCVHVCSEYIGANAITFSGSGTDKMVSTPLGRTAAECIGCGACVEICPAHCITMKDIKKAGTYFYNEKKETGPARVIHNWKVTVSWKKCSKCGKLFPPPSPMKYLDEGKALPKDFFDICENCR